MYENLNISDRVYLIYCDIGNYRHWVKESTNPEKFFENFDKLKAVLDELTYIDYSYFDPTPDKELSELCKNEQKYIQEFLKRFWVKTVSEAVKLKTDKGKANKIKTFFDSLKPYKERFSKETLQIIAKAESEQLDYTLKKISKAEKDDLFKVKTEKILDEQNNIMDTIETSAGNTAWFYQHNYLLSKIMHEEIDFDIVYDITRLMLSGFDYKKASRFLRIKYGFNTEFAIQLYITACGIVSSHRNILHYQKSDYKQYFISTHGAPCEKCQEHRGKIYNIKGAKIGVNFPPFCSHGCSTALLYIDRTSIENLKPLSYPDKIFAKAINLREDGKFEEAAEQGLNACLLVPESKRYIQCVPEMLAKVNRYHEAVQILDKYISLTENVDERYIKQRDEYKKHIDKRA